MAVVRKHSGGDKIPTTLSKFSMYLDKCPKESSPWGYDHTNCRLRCHFPLDQVPILKRCGSLATTGRAWLLPPARGMYLSWLAENTCFQKLQLIRKKLVAFGCHRPYLPTSTGNCAIYYHSVEVEGPSSWSSGSCGKLRESPYISPNGP